MNYDVFICYSSKDKAIANDICSLLEKNGVTCWIAPRNVKPGSHYGEEIVDAIESSLSVLLILSENSNQSLHVRNEVELGVSRGKAIFPVLIKDVRPSKALIYYIETTQWLEAWIPPLEKKIIKLSATIKTLSGRKDDTISGPSHIPDEDIVPDIIEEPSDHTARKGEIPHTQKGLDELRVILSNHLEQHSFDKASITVSEILKIDRDNIDALNAQALIDKRNGIDIFRTFKGPGVGVKAFFTRDGQRLVAGFDGIIGKTASARPPTVYIWEVSTGQILFEFSVKRPWRPTCLALSSDEQTIAVGDLFSFFIINVNGKNIIADYKTGWVRCISFLQNGNRLLTGGNELLLWDLDLGSVTYRFEGHTGRIQSLAVTSDGTKAVSGGEDATIRMWDLQKKQEIWCVNGFKANFQSIAVSSDDRQVLVGGDKLIRLLDLKTGKEIKSIPGHKGYTLSIAFSPDGQRAVSGGTDNILRIWDLKNGAQLRGYITSGSWTGSVGFSPDGHFFVSSDLGNVNIRTMPASFK